MGFFDSSRKTEESSRLTPYPGVMPGVGEAMGLINNWVDRPLQFYPDQTYAGQTQAELDAIQGLKDAAAGYGGMLGSYLDPATAAYTSALGAPADVFGMGLQDVASNPYLADVASGIQSRVNRNLTENILPQIRANEVLGPSGAVGRGIAARGTSDVLSENLADLYGGAWSRGLGAETARLGQAMQARQGALQMAPSLAGLGELGLTQPSALNLRAGTMERTEAQRAIDEDMARFQFQQMEPFTRGTMGLNALMPPAIAFGESERQTDTETQPSTFANIGSVLGAGGALLGLGRDFGLFDGGAGAGGFANPFTGGQIADPWGGFNYGPDPWGTSWMDPYGGWYSR